MSIPIILLSFFFVKNFYYTEIDSTSLLMPPELMTPLHLFLLRSTLLVITLWSQNMNEMLDTIHKRKSVRVFTEEPVTDEMKQSVLEAAFRAPTAGNQMLYTLLDITDQKKKDRLAVLCDHQPFIAEAPLVLIFLADTRRWDDCYRAAGIQPRAPQLGDLILACEDALIAAQSSVLAAESLGLGSCYIGDVLEQKEEMTKLLKLDPYVFPVIMVVYGYPTEQQKRRKKTERFDKQFIVQENEYRRLTANELRQMFSSRTGGDEYEVFMKKFHNRKFASDFALELNRSVAEYLKVFQEND